MFRNRATRLGSLCARSSVDPGSRGARRARGLTTLDSELPGLVAFFVACIGLSEAVAPVATALFSRVRAERSCAMVCPSVPALGRVVTPNFARAFLFRAAEALKRGDLIAAGALLREAIRRQCYAECEWFDCLPQSSSDRMPPVTLLRALRRAGKCGRDGEFYGVIKEAIDLANAAVHCVPVKASYLRTSIVMFHHVIDSTPCLQPANIAGIRQEPGTCFENADYDLDDCDDDRDRADWWKPEGWNPGGVQ